MKKRFNCLLKIYVSRYLGVYSSIAKKTRQNKVRTITVIRKLLRVLKKWSPYPVRYAT